MSFISNYLYGSSNSTPPAPQLPDSMKKPAHISMKQPAPAISESSIYLAQRKLKPTTSKIASFKDILSGTSLSSIFNRDVENLKYSGDLNDIKMGHALSKKFSEMTPQEEEAYKKTSTYSEFECKVASRLGVIGPAQLSLNYPSEHLYVDAIFFSVDTAQVRQWHDALVDFNRTVCYIAQHSREIDFNRLSKRALSSLEVSQKGDQFKKEIEETLNSRNLARLRSFPGYE